MSTERWIGGTGQGLTWGNAISTSTLTSLSNGSAVLSDVAINNSTTLDIFADFSIALASAAFAAPNYIGLYLYPLNQDGSTYGDGRFASAASGPPSSTYWVGNVVIPAATGAQEGTLRGVIMPPGQFKMVVYNQGGIALSSSSNSMLYRTYNRQVS